MDIDYSLNLGKPSVKYIISALQKIVDDNPEINFHKVGVCSMDGKSIDYVELASWEYKGNMRFSIEVE